MSDLPFRSQCTCACHTTPGMIHFKECCQPDPKPAPPSRRLPKDELLRERDEFIASKGLWNEFMNSLIASGKPAAAIPGFYDPTLAQELRNEANWHDGEDIADFLRKAADEIERLYIPCDSLEEMTGEDGEKLHASYTANNGIRIQIINEDISADWACFDMTPDQAEQIGSALLGWAAARRALGQTSR